MIAEKIERAREVLSSRFGYPEFRAGQERAVESILGGRDTLVILPTGGGKSLCYQVPALVQDGLTVVVSPLISLMKDQVDALEARGIPATFVNSTLAPGQVSERMARVQRGEIKLLYVAPERFDAGNTAERLRACGIAMLAIDEAHCISEWGHDFRPSYLRLRSVRERLGDPPTIALTATATPEVRRDIARQLGLRDAVTVITGFDRTNLAYHVVPVKNDQEKDAALVREIKAREGLCIVYAATRKSVERVAKTLSAARIPAIAYHAGLDDRHRHDVQEAFMTERVRAIVATNAFGMGIDKPNVRLVVHYTMPRTLEAYYQEAGRAGRDRQPAECVLLHAFQDRFTHEFFIKGANPDRKAVESVFRALEKLADSTGLVSADFAELARVAGKDISDREAESALRILSRAGVVAVESATHEKLWVRLLAAPERIRRELGDERQQELELLRALWRGVGRRLHDGAVIDPEGLPPGFGGARNVAAILESLQREQFVAWARTGGGIRLLAQGQALSAFGIDWPTLERRRKGELAKLDAVQRYAYTSECRRGFVLRYFGDPDAKRKCTGCDNCLGTTAPRQASTGKRKSGGRTGRARPAPSVSGGAVNVILLDRLRALRSRLAREANVPAYVIFPDRSLEALSASRPTNAEELADIPGLGPTRIERYGQRILASLAGE
jgi:ATP-dependent DNA helicase RecQ